MLLIKKYKSQSPSGDFSSTTRLMHHCDKRK